MGYYERQKHKTITQLKELAKDDVLYLSHLRNNVVKYIKPKNMRNLLSIGNARLAKPELFRAELVKIVIDYIGDLKPATYVRHNTEIAATLKLIEQYLAQEDKNTIIDALIKNGDLFYPYSKKVVIDVIADFVQKDDQRIFSALREFLRIIETDTLEKLLKKVEGGQDNQDIQAILSKTKVLSHLKYDEKEVRADAELRRKLIKEIANTQSIAKRIPFEVEVTLDDIKAIPPAARLSFLQFAYRPEVEMAWWAMRSSYWYGKYSKDIDNNINGVRAKAKLDNLKMPKIDKEEIKDLLFSVSLQKNEEMNKWIEKYFNYLDFVAGKIKPQTEKSLRF